MIAELARLLPLAPGPEAPAPEALAAPAAAAHRWTARLPEVAA